MAWTYSGNPGSSPKDELRFLVGDTDEAFPLLSDEEVSYLLGGQDVAPTRSGTMLASVRACEVIIQKLGFWAYDQSLGPASDSFSQILANVQGNLKLLRRRAGLAGVTAFSGGIKRDDRIRAEAPEYTRPDFTKTMMEPFPDSDKAVVQDARGGRGVPWK